MALVTQISATVVSYPFPGQKRARSKQWESWNPDKPRDRTGIKAGAHLALVLFPTPRGSLRAAPQEFTFVAGKSEPRFPAFHSAFEIPASRAAELQLPSFPREPGGSMRGSGRRGRPRAERGSSALQPRHRTAGQPGTHLS